MNDERITLSHGAPRAGSRLACAGLLGLVAAGPAHAAQGLCERDALIAALAAATPGMVVAIGHCVVPGPLVVPPGVILEGQNRNASVVSAGNGETAVRLETAAGVPPTTLREIGVASDGEFGVRAAGNGAASIERVDITATRGVAVGAQGLAAFTANRLALTGAVTAASAPTQSVYADPRLISTHGLVLNAVANYALTEVQANGFATFGVLLVNSSGTWSGGGGVGNITAGGMVWGGQATLAELRFAQTFNGLAPYGEASAGFAAAGGAVVRGTDLRISRGEGRGIFHDGVASAEYTNLRLADNGNAGLWQQNGGTLSVSNSEVSDNAFAGIVAIASQRLTLVGSRLARAGAQYVQALPNAGDGLQLVATPAGVIDSRFEFNQRAGIVIDTGGALALSDFFFDAVRIQGTGTQLGVAVQVGGTPGKVILNVGIARMGPLLEANDLAFNLGDTGLAIAGGVRPCLLPFAEQVVAGGLAGIFPGGLAEPPGDPI